MEKIEIIKGSIVGGTPSEVKIVNFMFKNTVGDIKNLKNDCIYSPKYSCFIGEISFSNNGLNFRSTGYHRNIDFATRYGFILKSKENE